MPKSDPDSRSFPVGIHGTIYTYLVKCIVGYNTYLYQVAVLIKFGYRRKTYMLRPAVHKMIHCQFLFDIDRF
ncbi:hypothetical protein ASPVEDRAFT_448984 [Aspergillus versicolor CBS 583.65]|uniref:Uncharacterized protein n=1 Tax=Aspergillus versicolor CBS 583.65 TaxID=1036611 RepID=A0A1L9P9N6_ASPVE|nr:uncharacterized protein ASPVEDRAFT_448984 [Aspergillus versicolor CBS 583.65]OJI98195.1 hypothetical protein ASPVEDRAFT_448984 [Aspergillus versicolor CBS 583.65]